MHHNARVFTVSVNSNIVLQQEVGPFCGVVFLIWGTPAFPVPSGGRMLLIWLADSGACPSVP